MKTVKFYNKTTGRWEPIAGITRLGGVDNYEDLANKPDLSIYATKDDLEAMKQEIIDLINSLPSQPQEEPISAYYTEYTIDNSVNTFSLRGTNTPISDSQYMPKFSNGYTYIKLTLNDGRVTTNVNTPASSVDKVRIYYPEETTYVKFTDTKVKDVEYIQAGNFTDATEMFKNCTSLQSADLSTLNSANVTVDASMFQGANTEVQLVLNDEWSYTNRDMGLIKTVEVVMHHYREDGLYEYNAIYVKSQYDEHPTQYVIRQVDPEDGRWRFEPFTLELETPYEIYFEDCGNAGETMNTRFMANMDIFFVGATPNTFTDSRPEIGGNEEPEVEYITGFTCNERLDIVRANSSQYLSVIPDQLDRPMNFEVIFPDPSWSAVTYNVNINPDGEVPVVIGFTLMSNCQAFDGIVTIRETNSDITKDIRIYVNPRVYMTVHYKDTDGNISDTLYIGDNIICNFDNPGEGSGTDDYGVFISGYALNAFQSYMLRLEASSGLRELGQINLSNDTEIWISEDSDEVLYENPNQPEEPKDENVNLTVHYRATDGSIENNEVDFYNPEKGVSHWVRFDGDRTEAFTDDFGYYSTLTLPAYNAYKVATLGNLAEQSEWFEQTLDATYDREIWIIDNELKYYTERPEIVEPTTYRLTINYQDPYDPYDEDYMDLSIHEDYSEPYRCYLSETTDFGVKGSVELPKDQTYYILCPKFGQCPSTITMDSNKEIWIVRPEDYTYEQPGSDYISGFDVDTSSITLDRIDRNLVQFNIYPHETGKQVSFSFSFEDVTYSNPDLLSASANTYEYDDGNSTVYGNVYFQMDDSCTGTATLVVREDNSGTEQRISLEVVEPQPVITGFTMTPESAVMNAENNEVIFTLTPNETDRPVRFGYAWGPTSTIGINEDSSEAPERYYFKLTGEKLYKEDLTFGITEERSGTDASSQLTIEAEHTYDEVHADLKVWYYSENQNFDGKNLLISSSENSNAYGFYDSGDDQRIRYISVTLPIGEPIEFRLEDHSGESESTVISTTVTINEDTQLWIIEGDSTLYTEQPEGWPQIEYATLTLHYNRNNGDYDNWHIWKWCSCGNHTTNGMAIDFTEEDDFGKIAYVEAVKGCNLGYIIRKGDWEEKNHQEDQHIQMDDNMEIWVTQGQDGYYTERPEIGGGEEPNEPEDDSYLVDFDIHIKDVRNAYDEVSVEWNNPSYNYTTYSLADAQEDEYGKYITVKISKDTDNYFGIRNSIGEYNVHSCGFDLTGHTSIWFDCGANQYNLDSPTSDYNISEEEVGLIVHYLPRAGEEVSQMMLQDGMYTRYVTPARDLELNEYRLDYNVLKGTEVQIEVSSLWRNLQVSNDTEIWLLPFDQTVYYERPTNIPSYTEFAPRIHLHRDGADYDYNYTINVTYGPNTFAAMMIQRDGFGVYHDSTDIFYAGVTYNITFYEQFDGSWEPVNRTVVFEEPVTEVWFIWGDENVYLEKPEI